MADRNARNKSLISESEQAILREKTAAVVGLGGLGGHIAEQLARIGFGRLILIDGDTVDETNLNRQLFATEQTLGMPKTDAALLRLQSVNSSVEYMCHNVCLTAENGLAILAGSDIVIDAVDNIPARLLMQEFCERLGIPLVHGSIGGWWGQVSVVLPGDGTLTKLYPSADAVGAEQKSGNPAFTPALVASIQVSEALKCCLGKPEILCNKLLRVDLLNHEYIVIDI